MSIGEVKKDLRGARHNAMVSAMKRKSKAATLLGKKGGQARAAKLSAERLREIGQQGANARWERAKRQALELLQPGLRRALEDE